MIFQSKGRVCKSPLGEVLINLEFINRIIYNLVAVHPIHTLVVHFPVALTGAALFFILLALWRRSDALEQVAFANIALATVSTLAAGITGLIDNKNIYDGVAPNVTAKIVLGYSLLAVTSLITVARWRNPNLFHSSRRLLYVAGYFTSFALVAVLGFLGGVILYGFQEVPNTAVEIPITGDISLPAQISIPASPPTQAAVPGVSFANEVLPILKSRCINCHGGQKTEKDLNLTSYELLMAGSENGPVILPGDAANSPLAQSLIEKKMPKRGPKLKPDQVQLLIDWINAGAPNN